MSSDIVCPSTVDLENKKFATDCNGKITVRVIDDCSIEVSNLILTALAEGSSVYTSKYRSIFDGTGLTLTGAFQTVYTYSGSGKFVGFILDFSSGNIAAGVKLTIDTDVIFDLSSADILDVQNGSGTSGGPVFDNLDKKFSFEPPRPILYKTIITIEVKRDNGTPNLTRLIVNHTKET